MYQFAINDDVFRFNFSEPALEFGSINSSGGSTSVAGSGSSSSSSITAISSGNSSASGTVIDGQLVSSEVTGNGQLFVNGQPVAPGSVIDQIPASGGPVSIDFTSEPDFTFNRSVDFSSDWF